MILRDMINMTTLRLKRECECVCVCEKGAFLRVRPKLVLYNTTTYVCESLKATTTIPPKGGTFSPGFQFGFQFSFWCSLASFALAE